MPLPRNYTSGAAKRKLKKAQDEQTKKMKGLMLKFTKKTTDDENSVENPSVENVKQSQVLSEIVDSAELQEEYKKREENMPVNSDEVNISLNDLKVRDISGNDNGIEKNNLSQNDDNTGPNNAKEENSAILPSTTSKNNEYGKSPYSDFHIGMNTFDPDPATWNLITDQMIDYFIHKPPAQNMEILSETGKIISGSKRVLTENNFFRIKRNSEKVAREWLVLSPTSKTLFCWICKLFSSNTSKLSTTGFSDWKHVSVRLTEHENSFPHRDCVLKMSSRLKTSQRIDCAVVMQYQNEVNYWRSVLKRVVATIKFLSLRGMAFFGDDETIGSIHNGNFLGCLELIAQFDPFLATHLVKYGNPGTGNTNYMSSTSINEFIELMGKKVLGKIIDEIAAAKYYSLILDSTPDVTHLDQLCFVLRYINPEYSPVERLVKFIPIFGHGAEYLTNTVLTCLKDLKLDIKNCRGQSYDNASNMAGKYSGLQARIKQLNQLAEFIPCSAHSLNLVGVNAAESCTAVLNFFSLLEELYTFFSSSTYRWQMLHENSDSSQKSLTLKNCSATRWCADANATKALRKNYQNIVNTLDQFANNEDQTASTKMEAKSLHKKLLKFETVLNTVIWDTILQRINQTSKVFQNSTGNIGDLTSLFESLITFIKFVRENFEIYETEAKKLLLEPVSYEVVRKKKTPRSRFLDDSDTAEVEFEPREKFMKTCHYVLCDSLISHLSYRKVPYDALTKKFSSLLNVCSNPSLYKDAKTLQENYSSDLEDDFCYELQQFSSFVEKDETVCGMLKTLQNPHLASAFPNVETALRIFLTMPISNCTGERSFSLLKRLKSPLRSYLQQEKLSWLALLCLNGDITEQLNYEDIIDAFAELKTRKKPM